MLLVAVILALAPIFIAWLISLFDGLSQGAGVRDAAISAWKEVFGGVGPFSYSALVLIMCVGEWGLDNTPSRVVSCVCFFFTLVGIGLYSYCVIREKRARTPGQALPPATPPHVLLAGFGTMLILLALVVATATEIHKKSSSLGGVGPGTSVPNAQQRAIP